MSLLTTGLLDVNRHYYPHMPIGKVWIYRLLFVCFLLCVCVFVRIWISPPRIKLATSHFARQFIGVRGRKSQIFVNFAPREAQNRTNQPFCFSPATVQPIYRAACGRRIGMCGYTSVPFTDVLVLTSVVRLSRLSHSRHLLSSCVQ